MNLYNTLPSKRTQRQKGTYCAIPLKEGKQPLVPALLHEQTRRCCGKWVSRAAGRKELLRLQHSERQRWKIRKKGQRQREGRERVSVHLIWVLQRRNKKLEGRQYFNKAGWEFSRMDGSHESFIFVYLGCSNKVPYTRWLINKKHLFLTALKAGKPKIKLPADSVSAKKVLVSSWSYIVSSHGEREEGISGAPLVGNYSHSRGLWRHNLITS